MQNVNKNPKKYWKRSLRRILILMHVRKDRLHGTHSLSLHRPVPIAIVAEGYHVVTAKQVPHDLSFVMCIRNFLLPRNTFYCVCFSTERL